MPNFNQAMGMNKAEALVEQGGIDLSKLSSTKRNRILAKLREMLQKQSRFSRLQENNVSDRLTCCPASPK
ncbi:hypothetical protein IQ268_17140 [Oculatella sp. LEGE 06141]|uniref:hypothetical protein n=1 Tax=Oculatella sp. LEGE 06141 TaxID=1828648 RepID=UPI001882EE19|nr:hypothetical protein [Oculatella sp. LEGE 06141]MBE9180289.1 hypothetical protein [Oculatella sp. LEGE 06141]